MLGPGAAGVAVGRAAHWATAMLWVHNTHLNYRLAHGRQREDQLRAIDAAIAARSGEPADPAGRLQRPARVGRDPLDDGPDQPGRPAGALPGRLGAVPPRRAGLDLGPVQPVHQPAGASCSPIAAWTTSSSRPSGETGGGASSTAASSSTSRTPPGSGPPTTSGCWPRSRSRPTGTGRRYPVSRRRRPCSGSPTSPIPTFARWRAPARPVLQQAGAGPAEPGGQPPAQAPDGAARPPARRPAGARGRPPGAHGRPRQRRARVGVAGGAGLADRPGGARRPGHGHPRQPRRLRDRRGAGGHLRAAVRALPERGARARVPSAIPSPACATAWPWSPSTPACPPATSGPGARSAPAQLARLESLLASPAVERADPGGAAAPPARPAPPAREPQPARPGGASPRCWPARAPTW